MKRAKLSISTSPQTLAHTLTTTCLQCDEAHPICRNCQKSKRECMGYDPIFKQQAGPAQIQPAPNSTPVPHSSTPASAPAQSASSTYSQSPVPQGYAPASSAGYAPAAATTGSSHQPEGFNAIDPALAQSSSAAHPNQPIYNGVHAMDPAMRGPPGPNSYPQPPPAEPVKGRYSPPAFLRPLSMLTSYRQTA